MINSEHEHQMDDAALSARDCSLSRGMKTSMVVGLIAALRAMRGRQVLRRQRHADDDERAAARQEADAEVAEEVALLEQVGIEDGAVVGLVEHQDDRADAAFQPAFEPPFDCRQVSGRRASWWRGRFQQMRSRARARPTVVSETSMPWWSRRWRTSSGAVQTVWR